MTATEFRAYVKNVYAATNAIEGSTGIPVGEGVLLARAIVASLLTKEWVDIPKV